MARALAPPSCAKTSFTSIERLHHGADELGGERRHYGVSVASEESDPVGRAFDEERDRFGTIAPKSVQMAGKPINHETNIGFNMPDATGLAVASDEPFGVGPETSF